MVVDVRTCLRRGAAPPPAPGKWLLDEVQRKSNGKKHRLWRAGDQGGLVRDILLQERRPQEAAARVLRRVLDGEDARPREVVTDTLDSSPPALKRVLPGVGHWRHKGLNNRAEHSRRPVRSPITSAPVASSSRPSSTTCYCRPASSNGGNSRASPPPSRRLAGASTPLLSGHQACHPSRDKAG